ncbi:MULTISPECIES: pro-sigmaK processing inhibitor BofA family protein [Cytobacillus]|uniref:pro-sigmaK processing inhibitor BofA family protein n=1 Tax=Cytobacillus TaxID=2675230 RepID=UPI001CD5A5C1|nr:pro-sigmaK processing inhibitor BofA family protein [Cytobacillus kochii]MCA1029333.1 pro-sigmaK processing inhibitor BofA family protein [Cytobacillus kochii]MCM3325062.1 pro-sigmaK processing inhibitor BofA family protein [Cytobacillus kochii]MCM3347455.1 pro-sigmaK processing inhibitor BofA family protein [Cytobacillus kochii]MDM5205448.1 pro-sigmaK processing inhibitor BofA family protein [Cytobacillus kochii]
MEPVWIISGLGILILFLLVAGASFRPIKWIGQGLIKIIIGALLLFVLNTVGNQFGIHLPINIATVAISGILGVPGICALVAIEMYVI